MIQETKPKYEVGDILRHDVGPTALMRVTHVSENHGGFGHRYYGPSTYGSAMGAYEVDCKPASKEDLAVWERERKKYNMEDLPHGKKT